MCEKVLKQCTCMKIMIFIYGHRLIVIIQGGQVELLEDLTVSSPAGDFLIGLRDPTRETLRAKMNQVGRRGRKLLSNSIAGIEDIWPGDPSTCNKTKPPDPPRPLYAVGLLSPDLSSP